jgi:type II secretory pathway pseudopilin PulG
MKHRKNSGFSLAALMFIATAVSIVASAAYPAYKMQAKRQTEEELIFRGEEYARAIQKFYRKFGVYPPSIDALVQTNGLRFLRRVYKDPITGKDFRLISISPDGTLIGSSLPTQRVNNTPLFGAPAQTFSGQTPAPGQPPTATQPPSGPAAGNPRSPVNPSNSANPSTPANSTQRPGLASIPAFGSSTPAQTPPQGAPRGTQTSSTGFQQPTGGTFGSAGVVGVGSESTETSIKVYNQRQKYNEWEFIAIMTPTAPQAPGGPLPPGTGTPPPPGQGPGTLNPPAAGGSPSNPFQTPTQTPFKRP